jgi:membrane-associated phospholipid phosphatase
VLASLAVLLLWVAVPAKADSPYELKRSEEYIWLGSGVALWTIGTIAMSQVHPLSPAEVQALDVSHINHFDRDSMSPYRDDHAGDGLVLASFLLPFGLLANDDMRGDAGDLGAMWLEATLLNSGLATVTKSIFQRTRPYAYDPNANIELKTTKDARLSFYSWHTSTAATNCFFAATVFSDYSSNRNAEIAMWSAAILYPAITGFFRVDSGHHFTTDSITGYLVGAAAGYLVPVMHRRHDSKQSVTPTDVGGSFGLAWTVQF